MPDLTVQPIRNASRRLVRELGFMKPTLAGTDLPPSAVHTLIEIGEKGALTSAELCDLLALEKSSISRLVRKLVGAGELVEGTDRRDGRAKPLSLTPKGRQTLAAIDTFATAQVEAALEKLPPSARGQVESGLTHYTAALQASRTGTPVALADIAIERGYRPGVIGRTAEMHARYYSRAVGFGSVFESRVAAGLAEFAGRLDRPVNEIWVAVEAGEIIGSIAIDGEDLGADVAHLRWFILEDGRRGGGVGRRLLSAAIAFCDQQGFAETQLWTFRGLDAARKLYEASGFVLVEEQPGAQWGKQVMEQRFVRRA